MSKATGSGGVTKKHTRSRGRAKAAQDPYASAYGAIPFHGYRGRAWTKVGELGEAAAGKHVLVLGVVQAIRGPSGWASTVLVLNNCYRTVRCVVHEGEGVTSRMVRFAATLPRGTLVDLEGVVSLPLHDTDTTQQVEIQVRKIHAIDFDTRPRPSPRPSFKLEQEQDLPSGEDAQQVGTKICSACLRPL